MVSQTELRRPALIIVGECTVRLWGLSAAERLRRGFGRAGAGPHGADPDPDASAIVVRADYAIEDRLAQAFVRRPGIVLVAPRPTGGTMAVAAHARAGQVAAAIRLVRTGILGDDNPVPPELEALSAAELGSTWNIALRKKAEPYVLSLAETPLDAAERATFGASYKGATDFVTKYLWPVPARHATRWAARAGLTPNMVTAVSLVLVFVAMWLFAAGWFLTGCAVAWLMTFLDTVDGKLARVTLTSSKWGEVFDHGIDLIHPPFWWWGWWAGLSATPIPQAWLDLALVVILVGYVLGRLIEGIFIAWFKIETFVWRPVDSAFRTITARRNPNLAILTVSAVLGRPDLGLLGVAVWTVISILFHTVRLLQAAWTRLQGGEVRSWLREQA